MGNMLYIIKKKLQSYANVEERGLPCNDKGNRLMWWFMKPYIDKESHYVKLGLSYELIHAKLQVGK